jgi:hypothetical protein
MINDEFVIVVRIKLFGGTTAPLNAEFSQLYGKIGGIEAALKMNTANIWTLLVATTQ